MRPLGQVEPGVLDGRPDAVGVEGIAHDRVADAVATADPLGVADHHDLRLVELDTGRAGGHRREQRPVVHHVGVGRHLDLAERDGDAEAGRAVGQVHRLVGVVGPDGLAARLRVTDGVDRQQRRLGLHVVHVGRVGDAGALHGDLHGVGDLADHPGVADLLGQDRLAHREPDRQPRLVGLLGLVGWHGGEDRRVRADDPVGAAGPHDRHLLDLVGRSPLGDQHLAEGAVGDDPGVVVDAAVALGLADDGDHAAGVHHAVVDELGQLAGVGHAVDRDLADLDGLGHGGHLLLG